MNPFWSVTLFWIAAAVSIAIALAFVLPPLLRKKAVAAKAARRDINIAVYRDQMKEMEADRANGLLSDDQYQSSKLELESRLAEDALSQADAVMAPVASRRLGFTLAGVLPVAALGLYFWLGNPMSLIAIAEAQANPAMEGAVQGEHDVMKMIQQVEEKTRKDPNDVAAWAMLGKTYAVVGHWPEALHAYEKAYKLKPDEPAIMTGYAETLAISQDRVMKGEPIRLVLQALEKDPDDIKGLELAGINGFQEKNFTKAAFYFKHLHKQLPPDSPYAQDILAAQKEATRLSRGAMTGMDNLADQGPAAAAGPGATLHGKVDIAPALKAKITDKDVVFLFARSAEGGAPVAAIRSTAVKFPLEFELNDAMAMNPENRLSNFKQVTLTVRVSKSGDPMGEAGDLEGALAGVKVGSKDIKLMIDKVKP
ncbi:MAG: c-type cytochrome biogenesis protein CcmI [Pseudomonadota bacterium]|nr:c-type cytochrome biogenesis protein CcmI [Pseudomonadota bacterium]MDP1902761.1 c-type cytochrome biogenesis protein CcmI [Pseudomonadota bacterium]MDP2350995.1 c-type cytochrome biogenesis protein CcmI [Pseudomonadota bacterium]